MLKRTSKVAGRRVSSSACPSPKRDTRITARWATGVNAYPTVEDPLQYVLFSLQSLLDNTYIGRCKQ